MTFFLLCLLAFWILFLVWIQKGVDLVDRAESFVQIKSLSVLIAVRNEEEVIKDCLVHLDRSEGLSEPLSVIIVDDHSEDGTRSIIEGSMSTFSDLRITILQNEGVGKKAALQTGLKEVTSEHLFVTDGDCLVGSETLRRLFSALSEKDLRACFGPVRYTRENLWEKCLAYENLNTQCANEAFVKKGYSSLVNAANMMLHTSAYAEYDKSLDSSYSSGDDVFVTQSLDKGRFGGVFNKEASVTSSPPGNLSALLQQRLRWASKYGGYSTNFERILPAFVYLVNASFVIGFVLWLGSGQIAHAVAAIWSVKILAEVLFQSYWFRKYEGFGLHVALLVAATFPFYYTLVGTLALLPVQFRWKGRAYKR